jgi:hypothetical protein
MDTLARDLQAGSPSLHPAEALRDLAVGALTLLVLALSLLSIHASTHSF